MAKLKKVTSLYLCGLLDALNEINDLLQTPRSGWRTKVTHVQRVYGREQFGVFFAAHLSGCRMGHTGAFSPWGAALNRAAYRAQSC